MVTKTCGSSNPAKCPAAEASKFSGSSTRWLSIWRKKRAISGLSRNILKIHWSSIKRSLISASGCWCQIGIRWRSGRTKKATSASRQLITMPKTRTNLHIWPITAWSRSSCKMNMETNMATRNHSSKTIRTSTTSQSRAKTAISHIYNPKIALAVKMHYHTKPRERIEIHKDRWALIKIIAHQLHKGPEVKRNYITTDLYQIKFNTFNQARNTLLGYN